LRLAWTDYGAPGHHRYRFMTWKIGRPVLWLLVMGAGLKLFIH